MVIRIIAKHPRRTSIDPSIDKEFFEQFTFSLHVFISKGRNLLFLHAVGEILKSANAGKKDFVLWCDIFDSKHRSLA